MNEPLVALDARMTRHMSVGMLAYVREVAARLPAVAPDMHFVILSNETLGVCGNNVRMERVAAASARNGSLGEQFAYPRQLRASNADLIHYMSVYAPRRSPKAYVYTIHDLIHLRFPQYFSWKVPPYYKLVVRPLARSARAVITDATATVTDLQELLGVPPARVRVIPLGVSQAFTIDDDERARRAAIVPSRFGITRPYFLYAGNHRPHKNLQTLVSAWSELSDVSCDLVITEDGPLGVDIDRAQRSDGKLHLPGTLEVDDLVSLYAGCTAVVQPSLYEGFGLSVLEAMAAGAPAIVAQTPALLEVGGDATASFPATDAAALRKVMAKLLTDDAYAARLRAAGRKRISFFTWDETAKATVRVYRELLQ